MIQDGYELPANERETLHRRFPDQTVLARDVLQMSKVAKPVLLQHLFALSAPLPAQCVSSTKMLGQLHDAGNTTTLAAGLDVFAEEPLPPTSLLWEKHRI